MAGEMKECWKKIGWLKLDEELFLLFVWDPKTKEMLSGLEDDMEDEDPTWQFFDKAENEGEAVRKYHAYCDEHAQQAIGQ